MVDDEYPDEDITISIPAREKFSESLLVLFVQKGGIMLPSWYMISARLPT